MTPRILRHEGFLRHARGRWTRVAAGVSLVAILIYAVDRPRPHAAGDTVYGYTLGIIATGLILWLAALGIRKRRITPGRWSLKGWTSAHVWLGLALVVIATLHTGFDFGWNVHTLAYALMLLVVASGLFGVAVYAVLPARLSENRGELTERQMVEALHALDRQLRAAAQPLDGTAASLVNAALAEDVLAIGLRRRLTTAAPIGATAQARDTIDAASFGQPPDTLARARALLSERQGMIARIHRHMRLRAFLEIWLYVHVPATIGLIAAVIAHIVAVFFYW